nr:UbiH/UbiF family hydroxylase [uncultured Gellertiella sp.]
MRQFEIAVVGGGLAGMVAALALGRAGRKVVSLSPPPAATDRRTTALMDQSIRFLEGLGIWPEMADKAAALSTMQILDGTSRLLRAPPVAFRASEVGLSAFGYNFPNAALMPVLEAALDREPNVVRHRSGVAELSHFPDQVDLRLEDGEEMSACFVIGADGRNSPTRASVGIETRNWSYPQTALVLNFDHELPHRNVSTEFHTESGPFTQVPLPGDRSSLVWVMKPAEAEAMRDLPPEVLGDRVEARMQSLLGRVGVEPGVQAWPLSGMMAKRLGKGRVALVGEAAHVFPPIGAQGLNLSLRDVMALVDLLGSAAATPVPGDAGDRFDRRRRADVTSRSASVDVLNRSLLSDFLPVQMLRAAGLHLLAAMPPLRGIVMREGVEPGRGLRAVPAALHSALREKLGG